MALARAIQSSPLWQGFDGCRLLIRPNSGVVAVCGNWDAANQARLDFLHDVIAFGSHNLEYLSYAECEELAARLATELTESLGARTLKDAYFVAVPRGGLPVLAMLTYLLDLKPAQVTTSPEPETAPLIYVDDVALSGARFRQVLNDRNGGEIIFATLLSPAPLRAAIEEEPMVRAVLSARDLPDLTCDNRPGDTDEWRARWRLRDDRSYWIGHTSRVCFPWNEPDISFWNPVSEQIEAGWRLVPPELCLKNRRLDRRNDVVVAEPEKGMLALADQVADLDAGTGIFMGNFATGESTMLRGTAADAWRALSVSATVDEAAARLADDYHIGKDALGQDIKALIVDLQEQGFVAG